MRIEDEEDNRVSDACEEVRLIMLCTCIKAKHMTKAAVLSSVNLPARIATGNLRNVIQNTGQLD